MDTFNPMELSPYRVFSKAEWARLRADTPMTLSAEEVQQLQAYNDQVSLEEVEAIYLPLARLLSMYVEATQALHATTNRFLGRDDGQIPFVIGIAGSVAVGKSTTARLLQALLSRWPTSPTVDLVPTDGFLFPNAVLEAEGLMERKGFPESYDLKSLLAFLHDVKSGVASVEAPVYSHLTYDVVDGETIRVDRPDILILEGLNVLQTSRLSRESRGIPFVSDFFDYSIYIEADEEVLHRWYMERFMRLKGTRFHDPRSYFHKYADISDDEALTFANRLWNRINLVNLRENIRPTRPRADLILSKNAEHRIETVALRKI
ncbi:type I pantothenate kinase [Amorphus orientalis]|uniref:Pantothenate kinase n=1 Tax=Amorphus orientalis TaxID=649198 RepID=A0AAE3VPY3_9HYPH|nr:type I pantothenate kinase [Amorphus orientalis]MDQ0316689.1 type I pantothenate kinase [Amorphus orientalis]